MFLLTVVVLTFVCAFITLSSVKIAEMGLGTTWVFEVIPIPYWISIIVIVAALFIMINRLDDKLFSISALATSIILILCVRMAFPVMFTSIPAYEPDTSNYMNIVNNWVQTGIDFGAQGAYQHNFPLSFILAFTFVKLGVPLDIFYRVAPFVIYSLFLIFLYLIIKEISPSNKRNILPVLCVFLVSFSSLAYWLTIHFCPDLFGSLMYMVALLFAIRFAKLDTWSPKSMLPVLIAIFLLILSHHLSTLYLIITLAGFTFMCWFLKPAQFKNGLLKFFVLSIYTYTLWFAYGTLMYPSFFNVYVYFSGFSSVPAQVIAGGYLNNFAFAVYPLFILALSITEIFKTLNIDRPAKLLNNLKNFRGSLQSLRVKSVNDPLLIFLFGFSAIIVLFVLGLGIPALLGSRILEVALIGFYPFASQAIYRRVINNPSRKTKSLFLILLLLVIIIDIYRYYSSLQRRVILA